MNKPQSLDLTVNFFTLEMAFFEKRNLDFQSFLFFLMKNVSTIVDCTEPDTPQIFALPFSEIR